MIIAPRLDGVQKEERESKILSGLAPLRSLKLNCSEPVLGLVLLEAVPAVDRPALGGFEGNLGLCAAVGANNVEHFAGSIVPGAVVSAGISSVSVHY